MTPTSPSDLVIDPSQYEEINDLFIDSELVRLLPKDMFGTKCAACLRDQSKWAVKFVDLPDPLPVCSFCFLYESSWSVPRQKELAAMIEEQEKTMQQAAVDAKLKSSSTLTAEQLEALMGAKWPRDEQGRLSDCRQCDDIMGKIYLVSRVHTLEMMKLQQMSENRVIVPPLGHPQFSPVPPKGK